jgi:2-succinyl-6-hydroxy-2,4-cyclohexadiene-1-carboxylate synthase
VRLPVNGIGLWVVEANRHHSLTPLLLLHGFTGSASTWSELAGNLGRRTLAIDLIGHGQSDAPLDADRYTMERCVADVVTVLDTLGLPRVDVLGYSMGGRLALHLALAAPQRVRALILESGSPGLSGAADRSARREADEALADSIERDGVAVFVDIWERLPLLALADHVTDHTRQRLRQTRLSHAPIGLANSLRGMGTGRQISLWDRLVEVTCPTLLVVGERDGRYREIAEHMRALVPAARTIVVREAGHTVHVDQPDAFANHVAAFLDGVDAETTRRGVG